MANPKLLMSVILGLALSATSAAAQTPAAVQAQINQNSTAINAVPWNNGIKAVTGPIVRAQLVSINAILTALNSLWTSGTATLAQGITIGDTTTPGPNKILGRTNVGVANATTAWPDTIIPATSVASQLYSLTTGNQAGYIGGAFNTRTSDAPLSGGVTEAIQALAVNDKTTGSRTAWGAFVESVMGLGATGTSAFGVEITSDNLNSDVGTSDPFTSNITGQTIAIRADCFGNFNCTTAMDVRNNGEPVNAGIVFGSNAISTTYYTNPPAIAMASGANGHALTWFAAAAKPTWSIFSSDATGSSATAKSIVLSPTTAYVSTSVGVGGTGSLNLATGELGLFKEAASGSAPGAAGGKIELVCGTNSGTAKLIVYAGTSTTPATLLDNIGSGVTGC
jgi:hypothetical protein